MKRIFDILLALALLAVFAPLMMVIALSIKFDSRGPALHLSRRVGRHNVLFTMPKFRTMRVEAPQLATHLLPDPARWITRVGAVLRKTSLDELPQLWSILRGDMSFVGPRPALFNQNDLVEARTARRIDRLVPGLTGWAQINGRDNLSIAEKVMLDEFYLQNCSLALDARIILHTIVQAIRGDDVIDSGRNMATPNHRRAA